MAVRRGRSRRDRAEEDTPRRSSRRTGGSSRSKKRSGGRNFKYHSRSPDTYRERAKQRGGGDRLSFVQPNIKLYTPRDGGNSIRILPPTWEDAEHYGYDMFVNYQVGADNDQFLSLSKMFDEDDPIAEERKAAMDDNDEEYADTLKWKKRCGIWLIDRKDEDAGPQFWASPWTIDRDICAAASDEDSQEILDIDDPENGFDVKFTTEKAKGGMKQYTGVKIARNESPLSEDEDQAAEWLEYVSENPIPEILVKHDYDTISKSLHGGAREKDEDEDEERPRKGKRRSRDEDEDEDEDEDKSDLPSYEEVQDMSYRELKRIIKDEDLDIDPDEFDEDEDLAEEICEALGLEAKRRKPKKSPKRRSHRDEDDEEEEDNEDDRRGRKRMRSMRR